MKKSFLLWFAPLLLKTVSAAAASLPVVGKASYYADKFKNRRTASGERYHPDSMTAAHMWLPFGTKVRVTNVETGKSVVVRVNDRGPYSKCIIDVSKGAARRLSMLREGVVKVKVELYNAARVPDTIRDMPAQAMKLIAGATHALPDTVRLLTDTLKGYSIQAASYSVKANALKAYGQLKQKGFDVLLAPMEDEQGNILYRLLVGPFLQESDARRLLQRLRSSHNGAYIVRL